MEEFEQYSGLPFPDLPELSNDEIERILTSMSTGKAISFDLFADTVLRDKEIIKKLSQILKDLWSSNLNKIDHLNELFKSRLIALNKVHPNIPKKKEFRPIIIMSLIVKIMEARWLPKLEEYMIKKLCQPKLDSCPVKEFSPTYLGP